MGISRTRALGGLAAILTIGATSTVSAPAYATNGCNNNTCMRLEDLGHAAYVDAWAKHTTFKGYFIMTEPNGTPHRSETKTWLGGKRNYTWWEVSRHKGKYCVVGVDVRGGLQGAPCLKLE